MRMIKIRTSEEIAEQRNGCSLSRGWKLCSIVRERSQLMGTFPEIVVHLNILRQKIWNGE